MTAAPSDGGGRDSDGGHRITLGWWAADVANAFTTFAYVGAVYRALAPFPHPGGWEGWVATSPRRSGRPPPVPPLSSLAACLRYAGMWGTFAAVHRIAAGAPGVARGGRESWHELVGVAAVYSYAGFLFRSERNLTLNNRAAASVVIGSIIYANTGPP